MLTAMRRYFLWAAFVPLVATMGIRDWVSTALVVAMILIAAIGALVLAHRPVIRARTAAWILAASYAAIALGSAVFGAFVMVPTLVATNTAYWVMNAAPRNRWWIVTLGVLAILVPWLADTSGIVPAAYLIDDLGFRLQERAVYFPEIPTTVVLLATSVALTIVPALMVAKMRDALARAEVRVFLQAWRLRQLLPAKARAALASRPTVTVA